MSIVQRSPEEILAGQIKEATEDLAMLSSIIRDLDKNVVNNPNPVSKVVFKEQLDEELGLYKAKVNEAIELLELWFKVEKEKKLPTNLAYHRLYKRLKQP